MKKLKQKVMDFVNDKFKKDGKWNKKRIIITACGLFIFVNLCFKSLSHGVDAFLIASIYYDLMSKK